MHKILYIVLFNFVLNLYAQDIYQIKKFADEQYRLNNTNLALKEYQRVFLFDKKHEFNDIYLKIANIFDKKNDYKQAIKYYNLAWQIIPNDSIKNEIIFKKVLCQLKDENYFGALNELYEVSDSSSEYFKLKTKLYEGIALFGVGDYKSSEKSLSELVNQKGKDSIKIIFKSFIKFNKKFNPDRIEKMSRILPGLGQIYTGDIKNGINSLALILAISYYAALTAVNYSWFDGLLILSSWFTRYYNGGAGKARELAEQKILKQKSKVYDEIIKVIENNNILQHATQ